VFASATYRIIVVPLVVALGIIVVPLVLVAVGIAVGVAAVRLVRIAVGVAAVRLVRIAVGVAVVRRRSWRTGNAVVLLTTVGQRSATCPCSVPVSDRTAKRRSPAGENLDQLRHGWRPGKPGGRAVKPARQADVSVRLREGVVPIDQDRGRAVEAPLLRLFLRGDQDALDFDPAPKFFESLLQSVVSHVPVGAPIEVEKLELHASILLPPLPPEVRPDGTHAHAADRAVALEVNGEVAGVGVDGADRGAGSVGSQPRDLAFLAQRIGCDSRAGESSRERKISRTIESKPDL